MVLIFLFLVITFYRLWQPRLGPGLGNYLNTRLILLLLGHTEALHHHLLQEHTEARARYMNLGGGSRAPLRIFSDLPKIKNFILSIACRFRISPLDVVADIISSHP